MDLPEKFLMSIRSAMNATIVEEGEVLQELWSGYGGILRLLVDDHPVIAKLVRPPNSIEHPRGWNTNLSHERRLKSYQVESEFYRSWSGRCHDLCRVPRLLVSDEQDCEVLLVLEDLDAAGFPMRNLSRLESCLKWLANFHAAFMNVKPVGLWEVGTYWHLATRPDEFTKLEEGILKDAASVIDACLNSARFQTLVHGDAKLANFCFSESGKLVAAVDFQYVGGGCGMKDVAYLIGSCLSEPECEAREGELLDLYFTELTAALAIHHPSIAHEALIHEWRDLYPLAWADFHRFLQGWSPGHWKLTSYSERMVTRALESI